MKCLKPIQAWKIGQHYNDHGQLKDTITFSFKEALQYLSISSLEKHEISLPCGKCEACLKNKRLEQSIRIIHEIEAHEENCFITLTYNPENLPYTNGQELIRGSQNATDGFYPTLNIEDYQKWLKRFRKRIKKYTGKIIRYFIVGEYGTKGKRPHYHAIIFGWQPKDLQVHKHCGNYYTYRSAFLEKTWKHGFSEIGIDVNAGVAKYCAQYVTKKFIKDEEQPDFIVSEFVRCSKMNGGLGASFVHKFHKQIAEQGYILSLNRKTGQAYKSSIPKYYKTLLEKHYKEEFKKLQCNKTLYLQQVIYDNSRKTEADWLKSINETYQKVKLFRELQKKQLRTYEQALPRIN